MGGSSRAGDTTWLAQQMEGVVGCGWKQIQMGRSQEIWGRSCSNSVLPMLAPGAVITWQFASLSPDRQRLTPASGFTASLGFGDMGFRNFFQDPLRRG